MVSKKKLIIDTESEDLRLDVFISEKYPHISRTKIQKCIEDGIILLNNTHAKKRAMLKDGDVVELDEEALTRSAEIHVEPQEIPLDILYEDTYFVAVNKPAGMVVHPGSGNRDQTLVNALLFHMDSLSSGSAGDRPGIVHRIDKETSGLIVAAKNDEAHNALADFFAQRKVEKEYTGFCIGKYPKETDTIDAPIGRKKNDPVRFCITKNGKEALTDYKLISHKSGISLLSFYPRTGRTHQIRIHCNHSGFPVVGDSFYGGDKKKIVTLQPLDRPFANKIFRFFSRHALHARRLSFTHPFIKENIALEAPFPEDFQKAIELFEYTEDDF